MTPATDRPDPDDPVTAPPSPPPPAPPTVDASTFAAMEDRWRRALAELDNLRKRFTTQLPKELAGERDRVTAGWLPVVDNLERALEHADVELDPITDGIRTVRDQAIELLARLGYPRHDETGVPFDPERHEAIKVIPFDDARPFTVLEVIRPGYGDGEHQLRPAAVVVAAGRE